MVKNKDRWSALSMSERADLIKLYVSNGITSLDAIKKDYNSFDDGGPTREMTPSEAAALNKTLNNSQYMLAVGDSPDDPAYLSTDYLEPAVVKAFNSEEEYNRYQGEKFGEYVSNEISEAGTKFAPILAGTAVAPWLISGGIAAYTNPLIRTGLDVLGSIDGVRNVFSDNGVSKTFRLAREGNTWGAVKSGIGDIFDLTSIGDLYSGGKAAFNYLGDLAQYSNAKWLDMPVPLFQTALDLSFPQKERDRVFREAHFYNERQKSRLGIPQNAVPLKNTVNYKVPSIRQQVLNSLGKTTSITGTHTAGAQHSGNDITFFLEGFKPFSTTFAPRLVAAHEIRHDIQKGFNAHSLPKETYGMFETPVTAQQRIFDFATRGHINSLSPENQFLFNAIYGSENPALEGVARNLYDGSAGTNWHKSLSEFDAELAYYREMYGYNVPWDILPQSVKAKIKTGMADRFSISEELVDEIATTLANHGYSNGGKLNKFETGGPKDRKHVRRYLTKMPMKTKKD